MQAYDPSQTGYEVSYFRPTVEEHVHGQGLPSTQEVKLVMSYIFNSHCLRNALSFYSSKITSFVILLVNL